MYAAKPGFIIGFHGCDKKLRDKVISGEAQIRESRNNYDWLGNGIYFWENNQQRALEFAKELNANPRVGKPKINTPAVLGAVIDLGRCLDLLDSEYLSLVQESYRILELSMQTLELPMPDNKATKGSDDLLLRNLDCAVIESLHQRLPKRFDSVRGVFVEGDVLYPNAGFHEKNHIQICIRNPNCIKGFFLPRIADADWEDV